VKGDHDSVVPESDNPWDNSGDRQHDTYDNEVTQSLDPQVMVRNVTLTKKIESKQLGAAWPFAWDLTYS
jgi:hypothetical protein